MSLNSAAYIVGIFYNIRCSKAAFFIAAHKNRLSVGFVLDNSFGRCYHNIRNSTGSRKNEGRKKELLKIAYRMFIEKGYDNTSIDDIIAEAGIAKGTYYYHFPSKEATLEAVIDMMISEEAERAKAVISAPIPVPQKIVAVIMSMRPQQEESSIATTLERNENIVMHEKINLRILAVTVPILTEVVKEGISQGIFDCTNIEERVKMILIICQRIFDSGSFSERDIEVFIDIVEKTFGAQAGTMGFIKELIH